MTAQIILVFSPHPDDEILGCGGFILKNISLGNPIHCAICSYYGTSERLKETREVKKKAGISSYTFLKMDEPIIYNKKNLLKAIKIIRKIRPDIILLPHEKEGDRDHRVVNDLVRNATWMSQTSNFKSTGLSLKKNPSLITYEVHTPLENASYFEDITLFMDKKEVLIKEYKSQLKNVDYCSAVRGLNRFRGVMSNKGNYAEAYSILKWSKKI